MIIFEKCRNCGQRVVTGITDERGTFCSTVCRNFFVNPEFCHACLGSSTVAPNEGTVTANGVGTRLYGGSDLCPTCDSIVQRLFFCILFIPVIPAGRYRVKYATPTRFIWRKLMLQTEALQPPSWLERTVSTRNGLESIGLALLSVIVMLVIATFFLLQRQ